MPSEGAVDGREVVGFSDTVEGAVTAGMAYVHQDAETIFLVPASTLGGRPRPTSRVQVKGENFEIVSLTDVAGAFWRLDLRRAGRM